MIAQLNTKTGRLDLDSDVGSCTSCKKIDDVLEVAVIGGPSSGGVVLICGNCLAEGLAIQLGRKHVEQGGDVGDLTT
jgi:hypothetical protein